MALGLVAREVLQLANQSDEGFGVELGIRLIERDSLNDDAAFEAGVRSWVHGDGTTPCSAVACPGCSRQTVPRGFEAGV